MSIRPQRGIGIENRRKVILPILLIFTLLMLLASTQNVKAVPPAGNLDPTFGGGGIVLANFEAFGSFQFSQALAIQSDGKILVGGALFTFQTGFFVARFNPDGAIDSTFGSFGGTTTYLGTDSGVYAISLQSDGKILALGYAYKGITGYDFALVRYNADGSRDNTFGPHGNGTVTTDFSSNSDFPNAMAIQSDGKIVATGYAYLGGSNYDFATARYTTSGGLDGSFGSGGKVITSFGSEFDIAQGLAIQTDGKIVVVGYADSGPYYTFGIARYTSGGGLDNAFGTGGKVTTRIGATSTADSVAVQTDGKIVVAGYAFSAGTLGDLAVARYNPSGNLDNSFGPHANGTTTTDFYAGYDYSRSVLVQADGKLVVTAEVSGGGTEGPGAVRYDTSGNLDTTFGSGGKVVTYFGPLFAPSTTGLLQADGKILQVGTVYASDTYMFLVRYMGDSADLSLSVSSGPNPALSGSNLTYSILVSNDGPSSALTVTLSDSLPSGVTLLSAVSSRGSCSGFPSVTCSIGTLNSGETAAITITIRPPATGVVTSNISLSSSVFDPDESNNSAQTITSVIPAPPGPGPLETLLPWLILVAVVIGFGVAVLLTRPKAPKTR